MPPPSPKRVLVTGAARRIGRAIAVDLAAMGFDVVLHANRSVDAAQALADDLTARHGVTTAVVRGDLSNAADVTEIVPAAVAAVGPLGVLVNNASIFEADEIEDVSSALFRRHMAINAEAPALLIKALAAEGGPALAVNITDQRVWKPTPRFVSYSASKATLWWLTRTLAQALAPAVRVNAIAPGPVLKSEGQSEAEFDELSRALPLGSGPGLGEFAATIAYLFETPTITGQQIALDGGQHLAWRTPDALINK